MTLVDDLVSYLDGNTALSALISKRIYPVQLPDGVTLPAMTYQQVDGPGEYSLSGFSSLVHPRYQFGITATSFKTCGQIREALKTALNGWNATAQGYAAYCDDWPDWKEAERGVYRMTVDAVIWHEV
jgi:hypothetical protein